MARGSGRRCRRFPLCAGKRCLSCERTSLLTFVHDRPKALEVFVPSYVERGQPFQITARMLDRFHNIVEDYSGAVMLAAEGETGEFVIFREYEFEPAGNGILTIEDAVLDSPGIFRFHLMDSTLGIFGRSNPCKVTNQRRRMLLWGDTHCHSSISADTAANNPMIRRPAQIYEYAKKRAALDFCMVTDHVEDQSEGDWEETRRASEQAYEPGRFVTFSGFEATYRPLRKDGDKNVYFLRDDEPRVNKGDTRELYGNLKGRGSEAMVVPHLHTPTNWELHDPELERVKQKVLRDRFPQRS